MASARRSPNKNRRCAARGRRKAFSPATAVPSNVRNMAAPRPARASNSRSADWLQGFYNRKGGLFGPPFLFAQDSQLPVAGFGRRSEEHPSELQSLMPLSYAGFCLQKNNILSIPPTRKAQ